MTSLIIMPLEGKDGCIIIIYDPDGIGTVIPSHDTVSTTLIYFEVLNAAWI